MLTGENLIKTIRAIRYLKFATSEMAEINLIWKQNSEYLNNELQFKECIAYYSILIVFFFHWGAKKALNHCLQKFRMYFSFI